MKNFINRPENVVEEMLQGLAVLIVSDNNSLVEHLQYGLHAGEPFGFSELN
jgi:hypothetical protein